MRCRTLQFHTGGIIHLMCGEAGKGGCAQLEQLAAALASRLEEVPDSAGSDRWRDSYHVW